MKTVVTVEDGRVTVQVDDGQPVLVKSAIQEKPVTSKPEFTSPPQEAAIKTPISPTPPALKGGLTPPESRKCQYCGTDISHRIKIAKICDSPECKKRRIKEQNERHRQKLGKAVGVGRGRRKMADPGKFELGEEPKHKPLTEDAPPAKSEERSKCCEATVRVVGDSFGEGTNHYVCNGCGNACDVVQVIPPFVDEYNCGACRALGRFCRMHARLKEEGYQLPLSMGGMRP